MKILPYFKQITLCATIFFAQNGIAQTLSTGYFTEGFLYRHQLNPALAPTKNYVALPAMGQVGVELGTNVGIDNFLYKKNGQTVTFMHPDVSANEVMSNLPNTSKMRIDIDPTILAAGFKAFNGYNTIQVNLRTQARLAIDNTLIAFLKEGTENKTYDISNTGVSAQSFAEIALGHSHQIGKKLRIGAKLKALAGIGFADVKLNKAQINLNEDAWTIVTNAESHMALAQTTYHETYDDDNERYYVDGVNTNNFTPKVCGLGLSADFGASYQINKNLSISAAILDLGFISWSHVQEASTNGDLTFNTNDYTFSSDKDSPHYGETEAKRMQNDLMTLLYLEDNGDIGNQTRFLASTINVGVQYQLSSYDKLSFGALGTTHLYGRFSDTHVTLSANWEPVKFFAMAVSAGMGTYGPSMGWLLSLHPTGFNLYLGMDHTTFKLYTPGVPMTSTNFSMGINVPF